MSFLPRFDRGFFIFRHESDWCGGDYHGGTETRRDLGVLETEHAIIGISQFSVFSFGSSFSLASGAITWLQPE